VGAKEDVAAQTERIGFLLSQIMRGIFHFDPKRKGRPRHKRMDFTLAQIRVMRIVSDHEGCRMGEIAKRAGISMPTVTGTVNRLVEAGILARERDPNDRRSVRVHLTRKGKDMREQHHRRRTEHIGGMLRRLDAAERQELAESMEKIHSIVSKLADGANAAIADD
jgi:DNA-binding MarR family transcriptional regulator